MQDIFDITEKEIQELSDSDLRTLIGLLCEAELERNNLPVTAAKWGGNQRAADGGLDVYVDLENQTEEIGEIPRWKTGIQVKQESMPKSKIKKEMSQDGIPKPILTELARDKGAYLIACGRDTNSHKMLKSRLDAMAESCKAIPEVADLHLDFFDSNRIATWTRKHPSLVLWVKAKLGSNSSGWQPHDNWSECPDGVDGEFILDNSSKIYDDRSKNTDGLSAKDGLNSIRTLLHQERSCIRLAGLSGVGKTRFAQALYDERIGQNHLPKSIACYTDIAHSPSPTPRDMALQLIALNKRAILIVDNCPPDLHDELSKVCIRADSKISLLTIEYDIRDDKPERTDVFRMEPSSNDLIEKLISSRFKDINNLEARRIAEFSEGNARIAIALAETFEKGDAILTLENNELFKRLFHQRNAEDDSLMRAAEVLSLVYSFDGETLDSPEGELDRLAELAGMPAMDLYRHVNTLLKRGLAQKRSKWRAVLPHAIANRLAKQALENIPAQLIKNAFDKDGSGRLLKSYTRRLGYLHDSEAAQEIVKGWLQPDGWLGDVSKLNKLGVTLLTNIAPVAQEETLEAIERASNGPDGKTFTSRDSAYHDDIPKLLHKLAYAPNLFERCCRILLKFAIKDTPYAYDSSVNLTSSLFQLRLSGTEATIEQRLGVLSDCVTASPSYVKMSIRIFERLLEAEHFSLQHPVNFGALPRRYGYTPNGYSDVLNWYVKIMDFVQKIALNRPLLKNEYLEIIADKFPGIWLKTPAQNLLYNFADKIRQKQLWPDGWIAVRKTLANPSCDNENTSRLLELEKRLAPKGLYEKAIVCLFNKNWKLQHLAEAKAGVTLGWNCADSYIFELGKKISQDKEILQRLGPELVSNKAEISSFGNGLVAGCKNPTQIWNELKSYFELVEKEKRNISILLGFLNGTQKRDFNLYNKILDETIYDKILGEYFLEIQCQNTIDTAAAKRILQALPNYKAKNKYESHPCIHIKPCAKIDPKLLNDILSTLCETQQGRKAALRIISMKISKDKEDSKLTLLAQDLCFNLLTDRLSQDELLSFRNIIACCFGADKYAEKAHDFCQLGLKSYTTNNVNIIKNLTPTINSLIEVHPQVVLNTFLLNTDGRPLSRAKALHNYDIAFLVAPHAIKWCEEDPKIRFPKLSTVTPLFFTDISGRAISLNPVAEQLLEHAHKHPKILKELTPLHYPEEMEYYPYSYVLSSYATFFISYLNYKAPCVQEWASEQLTELRKRIARQKIAEENEAKARHESFE
ncbi:hypothetical protein [Maridesulfovibrio sp.]|uniref:hypothetical protein n=1 Tax=unclassified Maridesulfovibrio TaxID=2794999 RepID=UPI003B00D858